VHAANARLEVWDPDIHSSNITGLPVDSFFTVVVNVTGTGDIGAFDMTLNYNLTQGPNVLSVVSGTLAGGLFDDNTNNLQTSCTVLAPHKDLFVHGYIRFAATYVGGCTHSLPGKLLTLVFEVTGLGVGSIDILPNSSPGGPGTQLVHAGQDLIPYTPYGALFWNKPGTPPIPVFTYDPPFPARGNAVTFNATKTYDPENPTGTNHGIQTEPVVYDANGDGIYQTTETTIYGTPPADGTSLGFHSCTPTPCTDHRRDPNLLFVDTNGDGHWESGESVISDTDNSLTYTPGDVLVTGSQPPLGAPLILDPKIQFVDSHPNTIWDNGYTWDFGDGTQTVPGNVTVHIFIASAANFATGTFPVRLVVYDADDGLAMRLIQLVYITPGVVHDVTAVLSLDHQKVNVGDLLGVSVSLGNRGTRDEIVDVNATYTFNGVKTIGNSSRVDMPISAVKSISYSLDTSSLIPGTYTVVAKVGFRNPNSTALEYFTPTDPSHAVASQSFIVQQSGSGNAPLSLALLAGSAVAVLAIVSLLVYVVRRRRKEE